MSESEGAVKAPSDPMAAQSRRGRARDMAEAVRHFEANGGARRGPAGTGLTGSR